MCGRATDRMVECKIRCNAPAETIAVHATANSAYRMYMCSISVCVVRRSCNVHEVVWSVNVASVCFALL